MFLHFFPSKTLKPNAKKQKNHPWIDFDALDLCHHFGWFSSGLLPAAIPWRTFRRSSGGRSASLTFVGMMNPAMTALEGGVNRVNIVWHLVLKLWLEGKVSEKTIKHFFRWKALNFQGLPLLFLKGFLDVCDRSIEKPQTRFLIWISYYFLQKNPNETLGIQFCHFFCDLGNLKKQSFCPFLTRWILWHRSWKSKSKRSFHRLPRTLHRWMWPVRKSCVWPVHSLHFKILREPCVWDVTVTSTTRVFKSHKISTFWSHSWHGGYWKKILTLLTLYNGPAALFCGFSTTILMAILFCFGILPSIDRGWAGVPFSAWCLPSGFVVTIVVMIFWRSPTEVFLDRICISQNDNDLKTQAIFSLAGLLKNSEVMLILWDPTWTETWISFGMSSSFFFDGAVFFVGHNLLDTKGYVSTLILWHWKLKT